MIMRIMFHLCPASKAAVRQEKYPAHVTGRNGVTGAFFFTSRWLALHQRDGTGRFFTSQWLALQQRDGTGRFFLQARGLHYNNGAGRGCSCYEPEARTTGQDGRGGFLYKPVACITWTGRRWYCEKCGEIVLECCGCGIFELSLP